MKKKEIIEKLEALEKRVGILEGPTIGTMSADNTDPDREEKPPRPPRP